jgi:hypothetical protein
MMGFDVAVKLAIYETIAHASVVPTAADLADQLGSSTTDVEAAFHNLARQRLLVLEPGASGRIRMAPPFSGVPTSFSVTVAGNRYYANCVWDALGIPAALGAGGEVSTHCAQSGEPLALQVSLQGPGPLECIAHFAVPAALWWDDIIYT